MIVPAGVWEWWYHYRLQRFRLGITDDMRELGLDNGDISWWTLLDPELYSDEGKGLAQTLKLASGPVGILFMIGFFVAARLLF